MSDEFLTTEIAEMIDDGSAIRPPIGSVTYRKGPRDRQQSARARPRRLASFCVAGGGRAAAPRVRGYWQTVSTLGAFGAAYWNVWFGSRMFFENEAKKRAGTFAFRIGMNWSFLRISSRRESTQAFICV